MGSEVTTSMTAAQVVDLLGLSPHPEGGHYRETFRDVLKGLERGALTAIYYLLARGQRSHWHRLDAVEVWHHCGGAPLELRLWSGGENVVASRLGRDLEAGERPQVVVPAETWQSAESLGDWTLVSCTVAPAFELAGFELAAAEWEPPVDRLGSQS